MKKALGYHYLIEVHGADPEILKDLNQIELILNDAVVTSGATEVGRLFHEFHPWGISGVILIGESHFTIHTWPEHRYAAIDFFTCNPNLRIQAAYQQITKDLKATGSTMTEIERGINDESA